MTCKSKYFLYCAALAVVGFSTIVFSGSYGAGNKIKAMLKRYPIISSDGLDVAGHDAATDGTLGSGYIDDLTDAASVNSAIYKQTPEIFSPWIESVPSNIQHTGTFRPASDGFSFMKNSQIPGTPADRNDTNSTQITPLLSIPHCNQAPPG